MKRILSIGIAVLGLVLGAGACRDGDLVEGRGVIHRGVAPECPDVWCVRADDGHSYWPVEDATFQQEGLSVGFAARRSERVSVCMAGMIVEFVWLKRL
jgi:hypothetical protein